MSSSDKEKYYMVFEGRRPGIYKEWVDADVQVCRFSGNRHQAFATYEQAELAYLTYCKQHGRYNVNTKKEMRANFDVGSSSATATDRMTCNMAENTSSDVFILQHSMQTELQQICHCLNIPYPSYRLHEKKVINGKEYYRYYAALSTVPTGTPAVSIGRFGKDEYDAKEDVASILIRRLLADTGTKIRDFNYYDVVQLQEQLEKTMDGKVELEMEICMLNEEMQHMKPFGN